MTQRYVVPDEMILKVWMRVCELHQTDISVDTFNITVRAFAEVQSENPLVPSDKDAREMWAMAHELKRDSETCHAGKDFALEVQRWMYRAPEPEVPEVVKEIIASFVEPQGKAVQAAILEAYLRGKAGKP